MKDEYNGQGKTPLPGCTTDRLSSLIISPQRARGWTRPYLGRHDGAIFRLQTSHKMTDTSSSEVPESIAAARAVMNRHLAALNAGDGSALSATLHFPHYRLSGGRLKTWVGPEDYLSDFYARAGDGWHHSVWDALNVIAAEPGKVHLDVHFTRFRADKTEMGRFRSLWVIAKLDGVWAAQLRSSFAP